VAALRRALEIAEAAEATTLIPQILSVLAYESFYRGAVEEGFRLLARGASESGASRDPWAVLWLAGTESDALLKTGKLEDATDAALRGLDALRRLGFEQNASTMIVLCNATDGLLCRGRTAQAAALIDPRSSGPVNRDTWAFHEARAQIDLLRGDVKAATQRLHQVRPQPEYRLHPWARRRSRGRRAVGATAR
jgi:hypothetical protein